MKKEPRTLAIQLIAWIQEEIAAQRRLDEILAEQERAIREVDTEGMLASGQDVQTELRTTAGRERRRAQLMGELARAWGIDPRALTLKSAASRLGDDSREAGTLLRQRDELRKAAADVARRGRRIASLARYHAGLFDELMNTLLGVESGGNADDAVLVDARV